MVVRMEQWMDKSVATYLEQLAALGDDIPVLDEMEAHAKDRRFPVIGRSAGRYLELMARAVGARRVMELGSGFGYSALWFARAVGAGGEVICTDTEADNVRLAERYLGSASLWDRVRYRVGDALTGMAAEPGEFDVVYCDVDKLGYPDCWRAARDRVRVGGLWLCDNTIWYGRAATGADLPGLDGWTGAIQEHNRLVMTDRRFVASIVPIRDGVLAALRVA
jgi:caffeoyl-CoA O-methyltransferase